MLLSPPGLIRQQEASASTTRTRATIPQEFRILLYPVSHRGEGTGSIYAHTLQAREQQQEAQFHGDFPVLDAVIGDYTPEVGHVDHRRDEATTSALVGFSVQFSASIQKGPRHPAVVTEPCRLKGHNRQEILMHMEITSGMRVPIDRIEIGARIRTVDPKQVARLVESIRDTGLLNPITVVAAPASEDGNAKRGWVLVAGAHRLEACRMLGVSEIEIGRAHV